MYRMLIADDEAIECRGLERMVLNCFENVELLPSVYNGVDLIRQVTQEQPDIVIVDINMPGLNGLEAVEILRLKSFDTKVIINTAYSDFEYVQKALVLGASDFLQKPMEEEKFREAVSRVMRILDKERREIKTETASSAQIQRLRQVAEAELMSSILLGKPNEEELSILFENLCGDYFGGIMIAMAFREAVKGEPRLKAVEEQIKEIMKSYATCLTRIHRDILYLFLVPGHQVQADNYQEWVKELLDKVQTKVCGREVWVIKSGVSGWKYEFERMGEAYQECRIALHGAAEEDVRFFLEKSEKQENGYFEKGLAGAEQLAAQGRWEELEAQIRTVFAEYPEEEKVLRILRLQAVKLINQCSSEQNSRSDLSFMSGPYWRRVWDALEQCSTREEICRKSLALLQEKAKETETEDPRNVYAREAILYIEKNYMKDLSLEQVADQLGISSFYLSRLLKHQIHISFVELLTDTRIEHAIELIIREDFAVKDIGSRVGYQSPTYFYKVFKKSTGMTVGEMRELLRR